MKTYIVSWTEHTDCRLAVRAKSEDEAIATALCLWAGGELKADTTGKPYVCENDFEVIDEED